MRKTIILGLLLLSLLPGGGAAALPPEITAQPGQVNPYKTRSELLMDAAGHTGVCTPEAAARLWARGLEMRSAAMQYTVMTESLKQKYAAQLDALRSNWVTGMSSPWVDGFTITEITQRDMDHTEIALQFETKAGGTPSEYYRAALWLVREGDFWQIEKIRADEGLYYYTLYRP